MRDTKYKKRHPALLIFFYNKAGKVILKGDIPYPALNLIKFAKLLKFPTLLAP